MGDPGVTPGSFADPAALIRARCHENTVEAYRVFARTTPGSVIEERTGLVLIDAMASDSMGNVAMVTARVADGEAVLGEAEFFFQRDRRPWILLAFPEAVSALEGPARTHGFKDEGRFPGLYLGPIPDPIPSPPAGVEVRRVDSLQELQLFERTASEAYEVVSGPVYPQWLQYPGLSFHLAYFHGKPVATATLVASHGLAGIVYVGTVPAERGRGFGRAVVWSAIEAGVAEGCRASALWASPMGRPMYEQMGFRPLTEYRIWSPPHCPLPRAFWPR